MVGFAASVRVKTRQKITANLRNNDTKYIIEVASKLKTMHGELFSHTLQVDSVEPTYFLHFHNCWGCMHGRLRWEKLLSENGFIAVMYVLLSLRKSQRLLIWSNLMTKLRIFGKYLTSAEPWNNELYDIRSHPKHLQLPKVLTIIVKTQLEFQISNEWHSWKNL